MFSFVTKGVITLLVTKEKIEVELTATYLSLELFKKFSVEIKLTMDGATLKP